MEYARDRQGRLIGTHQAFPHRFYACPVCSAEVFLRRGRRYEHHFAHRSNRGKPECELFHPSDYFGTTWTNPTGSFGSDAGRTIPPLSLSIQLEPEANIRGRKLRRWSLNLTVPKSDDGHGRITVDFGTGHPKTFDLSRLQVNPYTAVAALDATEFGVKWMSPEVRPNYRHAVEERIPGLDRTLINVFATSGHKNKQRVDTLTWGNSYYFVWHPNALRDIDRGLTVLPLAPEAEWMCALVTLPDEEEADTKAWLAEFVGLSFNRQQRTFGPVLPAPCGRDVFGNQFVPDTGKLLIGLSLGNSDDVGSGNFSVSTGKESASVAVSNSGRHLFEVDVALGKGTLRFEFDGITLPAFTPYVEDENSCIHGVTLEVRRPTGQRFSAGLHQVGGAEALRAIRAGHAELISFSSPRDTGVEIRWRTPPFVGWQQFALVTSSASSFQIAASSEELLKISALLRDRSLDVQIDAGSFGTFYDAGVTQKGDRLALVLSRQTRQRLIWVCKSARLYANCDKVPIESLSDDELAASFSALKVPPELATHKSSIERELKQVIFRGTP